MKSVDIKIQLEELNVLLDTTPISSLLSFDSLCRSLLPPYLQHPATSLFTTLVFAKLPEKKELFTAAERCGSGLGLCPNPDLYLNLHSYTHLATTLPVIKELFRAVANPD